MIFTDLREKTISSEKIFGGKIVNLRVDTVALPNGNTATREIVDHPGGVGVVAVDEDGYVCVVKQFRKPFDKIITEIPAGKLEYGEDPLCAAKRELEEETGYRAEEWTFLGSFYSSPGFCNEKLYLYLARELNKVGAHPDEDEFLSVEKRKLTELLSELSQSPEADGKTAIALLLSERILNG